MRQFFLLIFTAVILAGCSNEYLYDKVGFEPGTAPPSSRQNPRISKSAPDYYYRAAPTVPQGYVPAQPQGQAYYAPPPSYAYPQQTYYVPQQQVPYQPPYVPVTQAAPASRFYSNPYDIPASPYGQAYDTDQYYVAPNAYYGGSELDSTGNKPAMRY